MSKRKVTATVSGDTVILTGATALVSDDIKELAKEYGLEYTWDGEKRLWTVKGGRISEFIQQLQERASKKNIEFTTTEGEVKEEAKASLLELLKGAGFQPRSVGLIFGPPFVGKTTLVTHLAKELLGQGLVSSAYIVLTEPNVWQGVDPQIERIKKILGSDRVLYFDFDTGDTPDLEVLIKKAFELEDLVGNIVESTQNAFIAVDGLGEVILSMLHDALRLYSGGTMAAAPRISPVVSSHANRIANKAVKRGHTIIYTTHLTQLPQGQAWFGLNVKPSFANRALHSVLYVWRISENPDKTRSIYVVAHRDSQFVGKVVNLPPLSL
jgi:hypothetical protein